MKRFFIPILIAFILALTSCVTTPNTSLEDRVAKLERDFKLKQLEGAGASFKPFRAISGGTAGALDSLDGGSASLNDVAFVVLTESTLYGNAIFVYSYTDFGGAVSENLPYEVKPATNPNANYAWALAFSSVAVPVQVTGNKSLTIGETRAGVVQVTAAATVTLPAAAVAGYGTTICFWVKDASETCVIEVDASDKINLMGTALDAGDTIDSPGNAGDFICLVATTDADGSGTDGWITIGYGEAAWTDGGAT